MKYPAQRPPTVAPIHQFRCSGDSQLSSKRTFSNDIPLWKAINLELMELVLTEVRKRQNLHTLLARADNKQKKQTNREWSFRKQPNL
jgi:hypothetical protein